MFKNAAGVSPSTPSTEEADGGSSGIVAVVTELAVVARTREPRCRDVLDEAEARIGAAEPDRADPCGGVGYQSSRARWRAATCREADSRCRPTW
jgi:hypothetical protein